MHQNVINAQLRPSSQYDYYAYIRSENDQSYCSTSQKLSNVNTSHDHVTALQQLNQYVFDVHSALLLLFFGRKCLKKRSEKTEIALPKRGNDEKGEKQGRGQAAAQEKAQPSPASSRNVDLQMLLSFVLRSHENC